MTSLASSCGMNHQSRGDVLSLPAAKAVLMLHTHLDKPCKGGEMWDNMMSWTSSLLFAIQYAIWRRKQFGCAPDAIRLCVVDTTRFPLGQFAPDHWLLQAYRDIACRMSPEISGFFKFRLNDERYYNGDFLSRPKGAWIMRVDRVQYHYRIWKKLGYTIYTLSSLRRARRPDDRSVSWN